MEKITLCVCNKCENIIEPMTGFIVHGNIYIINSNLESRAGLIGNAFPETSEDGTILADDIKEYAYHYECLNQILTEPLRRQHSTQR